MIYRHPKYNHTLEVSEDERVKRQVLERAGWKADKPPANSEPSTGDNSPAPDGEKSAPKPRKTRKAAK